jgi:hypothetical protein
MKPALFFKSIIVCLFLLPVIGGYAQVKIGGVPANPHASAILELDGGTTRGLLLPRMQISDLNNIVNPAEGLVVFCTSDKTIYLRSDGDWKKISPGVGFELPYSGLGSYNGNLFEINQSMQGATAIYGRGTLSGTGVHGHSISNGTGIRGTSLTGTGGYFNSRMGKSLITDTGRVGLGIVDPLAFLHIDATKSSYQTMIINDESPLIDIQSEGVDKGFIQVTGDDIKIGTQATNDRGRFYVRTNGSDRLMIDSAGRMGLNTGKNVLADVHFKDDNMWSTSFMIDDIAPSMVFRDDNVNKGRIRIAGNTLFVEATEAGDLKFHTNNLERMSIESNGSAYMRHSLSIGSSEVETDARLHINADGHNGTAVIIDDETNPTIQLRSSGVDKGVVQLSGDDLRLATNAANTEGNIVLRTGGLDRVFLNNAGTFSLGSAAPPASKLYVNAVGTSATAVIVNDENPTIQLQSSGVDKGVLQLSGDDIKIGTNFSNTAGKIVLRTGGLDRVYLDNAGNLAIGTETVAAGYRVSIRGKVIAEEMRVQALANWPDYVFNNKYKLLPLESLEQYINTHHHLPNIPAAAQVEKEGIAIGEMQTKMMEKIEELTLYLIQANKEIQQLKAIVAAQTNK